jgi:protease I
MTLISDLKVILLVDHGVNQNEVAAAREALEKAGVKVIVTSSQETEVKAWNNGDWGIRIKIDRNLGDINPDDYHALIIPGGPFHADSLRTNTQALTLTRSFNYAGKVIAAIGHGVQVLISAEIIGGQKIACSKSLKTDVMLANGLWLDRDVVADNGLITCRCEDDIEKFNKILLEQLRQGVHHRTETIM